MTKKVQEEEGLMLSEGHSTEEVINFGDAENEKHIGWHSTANY